MMTARQVGHGLSTRRVSAGGGYLASTAVWHPSICGKGLSDFHSIYIYRTSSPTMPGASGFFFDLLRLLCFCLSLSHSESLIMCDVSEERVSSIRTCVSNVGLTIAFSFTALPVQIALATRSE